MLWEYLWHLWVVYPDVRTVAPCGLRVLLCMLNEGQTESVSGNCAGHVTDEPAWPDWISVARSGLGKLLSLILYNMKLSMTFYRSSTALSFTVTVWCGLVFVKLPRLWLINLGDCLMLLRGGTITVCYDMRGWGGSEQASFTLAFMLHYIFILKFN